jgi:hypothetical protein
MGPDSEESPPLLELKSRLILYLESPIDSESARRIYDLYMPRYGLRIAQYRSTAYGDVPEDWTAASRSRFEQAQLPRLYEQADWGYWFEEARWTDSRVFLFHGYRPASEPNRASIVRFDFEWDFDPEELNAFTRRVLEVVECVGGTAGYVLNPAEGDYASDAYILMFAWAMRYWGVEAQDLDAYSHVALNGFPCIAWSTVIGASLLARNPDSVDRARTVAYASFEAGPHVIIRAEERPRLIDRNRRETLGNYPAVAEALLPLQSADPIEFDGDMWDEDNTRRYLRRFTNPGEV